MEEIMKFAVEHKYFLIAIGTSLIGASARISYERDTKTITKRKVFGYFTASLFVAYLAYEALKFYDLQRATGFCCAIGGLISIDLIKILIEDLPTMIKKRFSKEITGNNTNNDG